MEREGMEDALLAFARDIFEECYVVDEEVQRTVVRTMLARGDLLTSTDGKFDLESILTSMQVVEIEEDHIPTVSLPVGLSQKQRELLTANNADLKLRFTDGAPTPHAVAWAQRVIDTHRALNHVPHDVTDVVDIGGNYMFYSPDRGYKFVVHCCNLVDSHRELHRQTQRHVAIESGRPASDFCEVGTQNCGYVAPWFISEHSLPCIDPALWLQIFKSHMFDGGTAGYHYDAMLDTDRTSGFIHDAAMHWQRAGDDDEEDVTFFFDMDSSFDYTHKLKWLRHYARPYLYYDDSWEYVVQYRVLSIAAGRVRSEFVKLHKATVGMVPSEVRFRWIGGENVMNVPVPIFRNRKGFSVHDPSAYEVVNYEVPAALYDFAFTRGFVNDTARPDLPISRDKILDSLKAYNHSMVVNGVELVSNRKLSGDQLDRVATGLYLAVVYHAARQRVVLGTITDKMMSMQRKWSAGGIWKLFTEGVTYAALTPFLLLSQGVDEVVGLVAFALRNAAARKQTMALPGPKLPYVALPPSEPYAGPAVPFALPRRDEATFQPPDDDPDEQIAKAREAYPKLREELPFHVRCELELKLFDGQYRPPDSAMAALKSEDSVQEEPVVEDDFQEVEMSMMDDDLDDYMDRDKWREKAERFATLSTGFGGDEDFQPSVPERLEDVTENAKTAIMEYVLYMADVQLNTEQEAIDQMRRYWSGGTINRGRLSDDNVQYGGDRMFIKVGARGRLVDMDDDNAMMAVVDCSGKVLRVHRRPEGYFVHGFTLPFVYACALLKIYNGREIVGRALAILKRGIKLEGVSFELVDGIAGCGKTRTMTQEMTDKDFFVTGPRAPLEKVVVWAKQQEKFSASINNMSKLFRTVDSALLHTKRRCRTLYFDEGLMQHSGPIYLLAAVTGAKRVVVSGDSAQIRFIDRGSGYGSLKFATMQYWHKVSEMNVSERCPADVIALVQEFLPERRRALLKTTSPIVRSLRVTYCPDVQDERLYTSGPFIHAVSVLQGDKGILVAKPGFMDGKVFVAQGLGDKHAVRPVLSTHESQGDTYPVTVSSRFSRFTNSTYDSLQHQYVEVSRHTIMLWRRSVCGASEDSMTRRITRVMDLPDDILREYMIPGDEERNAQRVELQAQVQSVYGPL